MFCHDGFWIGIKAKRNAETAVLFSHVSKRETFSSAPPSDLSDWPLRAGIAFLSSSLLISGPLFVFVCPNSLIHLYARRLRLSVFPLWTDGRTNETLPLFHPNGHLANGGFGPNGAFSQFPLTDQCQADNRSLSLTSATDTFATPARRKISTFRRSP